MTAVMAYAQSIDDVHQIKIYVQNGQYDAARKLLQDFTEHPFDLSYLEVEIAIAEGRFADAIDIARQLLKIAPGHIPTRQILADILVVDKRYETATFHYRELLKIDPDPQMQQAYSQQLQRISFQQPYGASASFSLTPSSNINGANLSGKKWIGFGGYGRYIDAPKELQAQFGWRASLGVSAYMLHVLGDQNQLILRINANTLYHTVETLDQSSLTVGTYWRHETARGNYEAGIFVRRNWGDGKVYNFDIYGRKAVLAYRNENTTSNGLVIQGEYYYSPRISINSSLQYVETTYDSEVLSYVDNWNLSANLGGQWALSQQHQISFGLGFARYDEYGNGRTPWHRDNTSASAHTGIKSLWRNGWVSDIGLRYEFTQYDSVAIIENKIRADENYSLSLGLQNNNWKIGEFVPVLDCNMRYNSSNIQEYESVSAGCGVSFSLQY